MERMVMDGGDPSCRSWVFIQSPIHPLANRSLCFLARCRPGASRVQTRVNLGSLVSFSDRGLANLHKASEMVDFPGKSIRTRGILSEASTHS